MQSHEGIPGAVALGAESTAIAPDAEEIDGAAKAADERADDDGMAIGDPLVRSRVPHFADVLLDEPLHPGDLEDARRTRRLTSA